MAKSEYKISTTIEANTEKFKTQIERAKKTAQDFKRTIERIKDAKVDADTKGFVAKMKMARKELAEFSRTKAKSRLDVNSSGAISAIERFKAMLRSIPNRVRTRLVVDNKSALNGIKSVHRAIGDFGNAMDTLATDIRTTGTIIGNMFKGVMLSSITTLVPATASLVPALMAVLNATGVVAGGAVGMVGAFATAGAGVVGFGAMAMTALKMVEDGTLAVTKEVENYQSSLESLKSAWQGVVAQNQSEIFNTLANAVNMAKVALQGLTPFLNGVAKGMETASASALKWAKESQTASRFFQMMGTTGVSIFNNMLSAVGNFGAGFVGLITNLAPLTEWVSQGFENMGKSFNNWANSVEGSQAIQSFTNYVKTNLPLIGNIFSSTFKGIFNLMKAFAPNSQLIFESLSQMADRFEQWSSTIAQSDGFQQFIDYVQTNGPTVISVIGNIVNIIINMATGMAPLASAVLNVVNSFTQWLATLTQAHPAIGAVLGVLLTLGGAFMALMPSILAVTKIIVPLVAEFMGFTSAGSMVMSALTALGSAFYSIISASLGDNSCYWCSNCNHGCSLE